MNLDLFTNATVVHDAMKVVSEYSNEISKKKNSGEESNKPDYDPKMIYLIKKDKKSKKKKS